MNSILHCSWHNIAEILLKLILNTNQLINILTILQDYLRNLPHCLLLEEHYHEWVALSEQESGPAKMDKVKK